MIVMGALYVILLLGEFVTFYGQFYLTMMVSQYSLSDLRLALFRHVERLPMAFFDRTPVGRLVSRMTTDIDAINEMFSAGSLTLFVDLLTLAGIVAIMFWFNAAPGAVVALRDSAAAADPQFLPRTVAHRLSRDPRTALGPQRLLSESLSGMAMIQLFTRERESFANSTSSISKSRDSQKTG